MIKALQVEMLEEDGLDDYSETWNDDDISLIFKRVQHLQIMGVRNYPSKNLKYSKEFKENK